MSGLRTLHINTERTWRGGEKQTLLLMEGLRARGHQADIICQPGSPMAERAGEKGITVYPVPMRGEADALAVWRIRRVMRRGDYQICQMHTSHAHTLGVLARGFRPWPMTVVARRVDFSIYRRGMGKANYLKYRYGVDQYFAISQAIRDVMVHDGIPVSRIIVVHSGVTELQAPQESRSVIRQRHGIAEDDFLVGNIGHLASHKGQEYLVRAAALLAPRYPQLRVLIVGEGARRALLEAEITRLSLGGIVALAGFQRDVSGCLGAFDLFAMPSVQEGLCTSILDAQRARVPVVASRTGGIPEIVRDDETGLLATPADATHLADRIAELLVDRDRRERLAGTAHHMVLQEFSVDHTVEKSLTAYLRLIEKRR